MDQYVFEYHVHNHSYSRSINRKLDIIMTDLSALQAAATKTSTDIAAAVVALNDLAGKVSVGTALQSDVDAITATLTGSTDALDAAVAADAPPKV